MTRLMIRNANLRPPPLPRRLNANLHQPLVNVINFLIPELRAGLVRQQVAVSFHEGAAAGAVDDDRVEFFPRERREVLAG